MTEDREGIILEMTCPVCGKIFVPAGQHMYKTPGMDKRLVCTYSCMLKAEREHEAKIKKKNTRLK